MPTPKHVLLLHGFGGHSQSWLRVLSFLTSHSDTMFHTPLLPGHGGMAPPSDWDAVVDHVLGYVPEEAPFYVAGYSLGGRVAYAVAARCPSRIQGLLAVGAHPGLPEIPQDSRTERIDADAAWANVLRTQGVQQFFQQWRNQPLFHSQKTLSCEVLQEQEQWQQTHDAHALACAMEVCSLGRMPFYRSQLPRQIHASVCVGAGSEDLKYTTLLKPWSAMFCNAVYVCAEGAGHNVLLEQPRTVAWWIRAYLIGTANGFPDDGQYASYGP
jgi:2-succinyl-6-hydroxy-2,4-cyclohexadiene-1-carboxylate synthase